jgi:hypothetical protein
MPMVSPGRKAGAFTKHCPRRCDSTLAEDPAPVNLSGARVDAVRVTYVTAGQAASMVYWSHAQDGGHRQKAHKDEDAGSSIPGRSDKPDTSCVVLISRTVSAVQERRRP